MITKDEMIRGWNAAGTKLNADLLMLVFKKIENTDDVSIHNFIMFQVNERLGTQGTEFVKRVAEVIEDLSMKNLGSAKPEKGPENG